MIRKCCSYEQNIPHRSWHNWNGLWRLRGERHPRRWYRNLLLTLLVTGSRLIPARLIWSRRAGIDRCRRSVWPRRRVLRSEESVKMR